MDSNSGKGTVQKGLSQLIIEKQGAIFRLSGNRSLYLLISV